MVLALIYGMDLQEREGGWRGEHTVKNMMGGTGAHREQLVHEHSWQLIRAQPELTYSWSWRFETEEQV